MGGNQIGAYSYDDPIEIPGLARRRRWLTVVALVMVFATAALFAARRIHGSLASFLPMAAPTSTPATHAAPGPDIPLARESTPDMSHTAPVTDLAPSAPSPATAAVQPSATTATRKANAGPAAVAATPPASESVLTRARKSKPAAHVSRPRSGTIVHDMPF
jgi:hypothetical protein